MSHPLWAAAATYHLDRQLRQKPGQVHQLDILHILTAVQVL